MKLTKNQTYLLVIGFTIFSVLLHKSYFIIRSDFAKGEVIEKYTIRTSGRYGGVSKYPVVKFTTNNHVVTFTAGENLNYKIGDIVDVIYLKSKITDARIYSFTGFWLPGFLYGLVPFIFLSGIVYAFVDSNDIVIIKIGRIVLLKDSRLSTTNNLS